VEWILGELCGIGLVICLAVKTMAEDKPGGAVIARRKRPFSVTLLTLLVLTITIIHLIRFLMALSWWDFLETLPRVSPLYLTLTGFIWGVAGLPLIWGLWLGRRWAPQATMVVSLLYTVYFWIDRLFVANFAVERGRWPFLAGMSLLLLAFVFWSLTRSGSRHFFQKVKREKN
jgi:hypothetical protein